MVYFCAFARSEIFQKNARKSGVGRGQFDAGVNGLKKLEIEEPARRNFPFSTQKYKNLFSLERSSRFLYVNHHSTTTIFTTRSKTLRLQIFLVYIPTKPSLLFFVNQHYCTSFIEIKNLISLKDVHAHCYCASLVHMLFIRHAHAMSFSSARTESKTQQNIELMTFVLAWCAHIFVECSVTLTFFSAYHFLSDSFHYTKKRKKSVHGKF